MNSDRVALVVFTSCIVLLIAIFIIGQNSYTPSPTYEQYINASPCNETFKVGLCKLSNTTWINCEKPIRALSDEHLRNSAWCEVIELYDVRT